jgi:Pretoxin HINT domain
VKKALRLTEHNTALWAAEKDFGNSEAGANGTKERDIAQAVKDTNYDDAEDYGESIRQQNPSLYTGAEQARLIEYYRDLATLWKTHSNGLTTARETRGLALSLAEKNNVVNSSADKRDREHRLTAAFAAYQAAAADHAQTFATEYSDKYKTFVEGVAGADATASKDFAAHEKTLADADADAQKTWNTKDTTALKEFYVEAADKFLHSIQAWAAWFSTPWTTYLVGLAQVELTRVTSLGTALVTHATSAGSQLVTFLTQLTAKSKTLADGVADGLDAQTDSLAGALKQYAGNVATARHTYALALGEKTALHDTNVASSNHTYKEAQAEREKTYRNDFDAAQWAYERSYAQAKYEVDYAHLWHQGSPEYGAAVAALSQAEQGFALTRRNAQAQAERDKVVGLATDHASWVQDIGNKHVTLAGDAKTAADALAASLKIASDGLTGDQAAAANALAVALAGAEKNYASGTATSQANNDKELAKVDGTLSKDLTGVANQQREGQSQKRGQYEVALYQAHATALEAGVLSATTTGIWSGGGSSEPVTDLLNFQKLVAAADAVWAAGAAAAKQAYEAILSTTYANLADDEYGEEGAVTVQIGTSADAAEDQAAGLAGADETLSVASTANLATFTVGVQGAASKAAKEGVKAETQYDLARAAAKATYLAAVATADKVKATKLADAELAFLQAAPLNYETGGWLSTPAGQTAQATRNTAISAASAEYDDAVKTAKVTHAGQIGVAQIIRVFTLGGALITEASEAATSEIAYVGQQNGAELAYELAVTSVTTSAVAALATSAMNYAIGAAGNLADLVAGLGAAAVGLATDMKPVNVTHTTSVAGYEGQYHASQADAAADRMAAWAAPAVIAGLPASEQLQRRFAAAESQAEADWLAGMTGPFTTYATAMATAEADELIVLAQALATADNSRAAADVTRTIGCEPVYYSQQIASHAADRSYEQGETGRIGTQRSSEADAKAILNVAYATAKRDQEVAYAEASKTYWVALVGLDEVANTDAITQAKNVANAEADLDRAEATTVADLAWSTSIAAGERVHEVEKAAAIRALQTSQSIVDRDGIIDCEPPRETHEMSYQTAEATLWAAQGAAADARALAEANALANFRTGEYTARASAIATLDATMDLPWTEYQAARTAAERDWWINSEKANSLALSSAIIGANAAYRSAIYTALETWVTGTAAADRADRTNAANAEQTRWVARAQADVVYATTIANARETRDVGRATNRAEREVSYYTARRDQFAATGQAPPDSWDDIAATADPDDAPVDRAFESAELLADALRRVTDATDFQTQLVARTPQRNTYVTTTADLDRAYTIAESNAEAARGSTIATAVAAHELSETATLAAAIDALATSLPLPWSTYDAAVLDAEADYTATVAPAARDRAIAQLYADRDFVQTVAGAEHTAIISLSAILAARDAARVGANLERLTDERVILETGAGASVPIAYLGQTAAMGPGDGQNPDSIPTGGVIINVAPDAPPGALEEQPDPQAKTFEEIWQKLERKWGKDKETILREFLAGVKEGFWGGVKDAAGMLGGAAYGVAKASEYYDYTFTVSGLLKRGFSVAIGWGDPLADENAAIAAFGSRLKLFFDTAVEEGSELWARRDELAVAFFSQSFSLYVQSRALSKEVGSFLNSGDADALITAVITGDQDEIARIKAHWPMIADVIDTVYSQAVALVDLAADQLDPHKLGYLVGQMLYEACEDAVITAAWSTLTTATAGAAGTTAPAVVAMRVANWSRKLELIRKKWGFTEAAIAKLQDAIWWALKHVEICFVAGTPVHTARGVRPIEEIQTGDLVYARPDRNPSAMPRLMRVVRTVVTEPTRLYHVTYQAADHREETLSGTGEHPFFVVGRGRFVLAKELVVGDEFLLIDGSAAWVTKVAVEDAAAGSHFTTYNFEVEGDHTYHVGELGVWVHNDSNALCKKIANELISQFDLDDLHDLLKHEDDLRKIIRKQLDPRVMSPQELKTHEQHILDKIKKLLGPGDDHHVISTPIGNAIKKHGTLRGKYKPRDPRFIAEAVNKAAHNGYQDWHRLLDEEIERWLKHPDNINATPAEFEEWLHWRYSRRDLLKRFPNGF